MMAAAVNPDLHCDDQRRRRALLNNPCWNGIDFLEVSDDQRSLCVHFFGQVPPQLTPQAVRIEGGQRIGHIGVLAVECRRAADDASDASDAGDDCLHITLDRYGDFSTYRLCLVDPANPAQPLPGLDPRYACLPFTFKSACPSPDDCAPPPVPCPCPPPALPAGPDINYLARDYDSMRRLLLERLRLTLPDWRERHAADIGITLVELLAYSADMLSYYQDAVATEAYLETARRRISVRRHLRLIDYRLHEGCNARAWVTFETDTSRVLPADVAFVSASPAMAALAAQQHSNALPALLVEQKAPGQQFFQPVLAPGASATGIALVAAHSCIALYTWGDGHCCLPAGACHATLRDDDAAQPGQRRLYCKVGDVLILEEVKNPHSGEADGRDPQHRHAVRLTRVEQSHDALLGALLLEVDWAQQDALPFALCLSARGPAPACVPIEAISVARGNVVLIEHGERVVETVGPVPSIAGVAACACDGSITDSVLRALPLPFRAALRQAPLVHSVAPLQQAPASASLLQEPALAAPRLQLSERGEQSGGASWTARADLLGSQAHERDVVAEVDDDGVAWLRFGDGDCGRQPDPGTLFEARYLRGGGVAGNVAAEAIRYLVYRTAAVDGSGLTLRNPLPAVGGMAPESVAAATLSAPYAWRTVPERAVTADDYAALAERDARVARARAQLRWNGSWYEACVAIDPLGSETTDSALRQDLARQLHRYRRMGHDVRVQGARYVPLVLALHVCVLPGYVRSHVLAAVSEQLSNRRLADGSLGLFHPDRQSFGGIVAVSTIVGAVQMQAGVASVQVQQLYRVGDIPALVPGGVLKLAPDEIAQLDNDRNAPEQGRLLLTIDGGR